MQILEYIIKKMKNNDLLTIEDLYNLSEREIIEKIKNCQYENISKCFKIWENATEINQSDEPVEGKYCVNIENVKVRYINPLVRIDDNKFERIDKISNNAKEDIKRTFEFKTKKYAYLDFDF